MKDFCLKTQALQVNSNRLSSYSQRKTQKPQSKPRTVATEQLGLFASPQTKTTVGVEPAGYRVDRFCVTVRQSDLVWQLPPSLPKNRAYELLEVLQQVGCPFELNESEGYPVESAWIHGITEVFVNQLRGAA